MNIKLSEVLKIYKPQQLDEFIKHYSKFDLNEKELKYEDIEDNWTYFGNTAYNLSTINLLKDPGKGLIERITNGIDAVLEKEKDKHNIDNPQTADDIIKVAFPNYYKNKQDILLGKATRQNACEAQNKVIVAINDSVKSTKPTIDVIDQGSGIPGDSFSSTILSIHKGNKSKTDKNYVIGAFGQGGSTSLPFSYATIIVSKYDNKYYFTIIKQCQFSDMKMRSYLYFTPNKQVVSLDIDQFGDDSYLNNFIRSESGTLIRMIDMEIPRQYRNNDISKPGMLSDYVNTELYNVALPILMVENRADYRNNVHQQHRNSFGTLSKMLTWNYVRKEYCGTISVEHNRNEYKINYYFILPTNEEDWARDSECKKVYEQFNVHMEPIIYTVNGQYIASERFTRLKNAGLSFLQYRLLVDINLDVLGKDKYRFFTTDRSQIQDSDLTNGFFDKVIEALKNEKVILDMNNLIASQSVSSNINQEFVNNISNNVKNIYNKFLKAGNNILSVKKGHHVTPQPEEEYLDHIAKFEITTTKKLFKKDEAINVIVTTGARKSVNDKAMIYMFVDGKQNNNVFQSVMNGRIQYTIENLATGIHNVQFDYYDESGNLSMQTEKYEFAVINEVSIKEKSKMQNKDLDLEINVVTDKELIVDISKNEIDKKITINLCLSHDLLINNIYGKTASNDEMQSIKNELLEPLTLYSLFLGNIYDKIEEVEEKNKLILSFCNTYYISTINK